MKLVAKITASLLALSATFLVSAAYADEPRFDFTNEGTARATFMRIWSGLNPDERKVLDKALDKIAALAGMAGEEEKSWEVFMRFGPYLHGKTVWEVSYEMEQLPEN